MTKAPPGTWARKVTPKFLFTLYDAQERLGGISLRWVNSLIKRHKIKTGLIERMVRLQDGSLRKRRVRTISATQLELLMLQRGGFLQATTLKYGSPNYEQ